MLKCDFDFIQYAQKIFLNSGRTLLRRGQYHDCIEQQHMKYILLQLGSDGQDAQIFYGACIPQTCSDDLIRNSLNSAFKMAQIPFDVYSLDSNAQNYNYPMNWLSYLTTFILITIAILVFIATVGRSKGKKQKNKWLNSFDLVANMKHFNVREGQDLNIWDGVRAISMMWVVIGHIFSFWLIFIQNMGSILDIGSKPFFLIIEAGLLAVDVFLCLGGFFLAFIMLRHKINLKVCGMGVIQRALRIWPAYILTMMFYYSLYLRLNHGPFWSRNESEAAYCKYMWRQVLFISNYFAGGYQMCLGWGWYLQVDFQLFLIGVILLYLYSIKNTVFHISAISFIILSTAYVFIYCQVYDVKLYTDLSELSDSSNDFFADVYITPYGRGVSYLMGLILGVLFMEYRIQRKKGEQGRETLLKKLRYKFETNRMFRIGVEWLGIGLMALVTFVVRPLQVGHHWDQIWHSVYWTFSKPIFILGVIFTILPSCLGISHSFFNLILTNKCFVYIARISFSTYLVHILVIYYYLTDRTYDMYYNIPDLFSIYFGMLVLCLFFGFIVTLTIELPFANLLKMMMEKLRKKSRKARKLSEEVLVEKKGQSLLTNQSTAEQSSKVQE